MTHRTTFALDEKTAKGLKRLEKKWKVSQAEVVHRAVEEAEKWPQPNGRDLALCFKEFHQVAGSLVREEADAYLAEVRKDRNQWRES